MKKLILSCLLMLCAGTMMATEPDAIFAKVSGSSTCYLLSKNPQVTIADGVATLKAGDVEKFQLPLTDGATLEVTFGEYVGDVTFSVSDLTWATIYSNENLVVPEGVKVYAPVYDQANNTLTMGEAITNPSVIVANKGYLLKASTNDYTFTKTDETTTLGSSSSLKGVIYDTTIPTGSDKVYLTLGKIDNQVGFYKYTGTVLHAGKAFLELEAAQAAKLDGILFDEGGTTAINNVTKDQNGQYIIYDLNGRRVTKMEKGQIYVIGNKKYLIK